MSIVLLFLIWEILRLHILDIIANSAFDFTGQIVVNA